MVNGLGGGIASVLLLAIVSAVGIVWQVRRQGSAKTFGDIRRNLPQIAFSIFWVFVLGLRFDGGGSTGLYFVWLLMYGAVIGPILVRDIVRLYRDDPYAWEALRRQGEGQGMAPWRVHRKILWTAAKCLIAAAPLSIMAILMDVPLGRR